MKNKLSLEEIEEINDEIYDLCRDGSLESAEELNDLLEKSPVIIDVMFDKGRVFGVAMAWGYAEVLQVLINYYKKTQISGEPYLMSYKYARSKLLNVLDVAKDGCEDDLSEEVESVLSSVSSESSSRGSVKRYQEVAEEKVQDAGAVSWSEEKSPSLQEMKARMKLTLV